MEMQKVSRVSPDERKPLSLKPPEKKNVTRVTTGAVVKKQKPWIDRISETFWGEDADTVGKYIIFDVLIPAAKSTLFDMVKIGVEMLLWGESSSRKSSLHSGRRDGVMRTSYDSMYTRAEPQRARGRHDLSPVIMETRGEAEDVLTALIEAIDQYKVATVSDYYQAAGVPSEYTDNNYGWTSLARASVIRVREGYTLDLPRPIYID